MIPKTHEDLLQSTALAHVATIGPHGEPQSNPVWFGWDGNGCCSARRRGGKSISICSVTPGSRYLLWTRKIRSATWRSVGW